MSQKDNDVPIYAAEGRSLGFRTLEAAQRLVVGGFVNPVYGRKGHLKAIFLRQEDGANPVEARPRVGTRYSFPGRLSDGHRAWKHKRLDLRDEDGEPFSMWAEFLRVVQDRLR